LINFALNSLERNKTHIKKRNAQMKHNVILFTIISLMAWSGTIGFSQEVKTPKAKVQPAHTKEYPVSSSLDNQLLDSATIIEERTAYWSNWSSKCFPSHSWDSTIFETDGLNYELLLIYNPRLVLEMKQLYSKPSDGDKYLPSIINSGSCVPEKKLASEGELLYKIVPKGNNIQSPSPYYLTEQDFLWVQSHALTLEQSLGLPLSSTTAAYDVFTIKSLKDNNVYFQSRIAATDQCSIQSTMEVYRTPGGGVQSLIINNMDTTLWEKSTVPVSVLLPLGLPVLK
jgi:hypothetical protein